MLDLDEKLIWSRANLARPEFRLCSRNQGAVLGFQPEPIISIQLQTNCSSCCGVPARKITGAPGLRFLGLPPCQQRLSKVNLRFLAGAGTMRDKCSFFQADIVAKCRLPWRPGNGAIASRSLSPLTQHQIARSPSAATALATKTLTQPSSREAGESYKSVATVLNGL